MGVLAAGEAFPESVDYWSPLSFTAEELSTQRGAHYLLVTGRLRNGVSPEEARTDVVRDRRTVGSGISELEHRRRLDDAERA